MTLGLLLAADVVLAAAYLRYRRETDRLLSGMTEQERERTSVILDNERHRVSVELELIRLRARGDRELHLAVQVDSGRMLLERDGVTLREMQVRLGPVLVAPGLVDSAVSLLPRGDRTIERILTVRDAWEIPESYFRERGLTVPDNRAVRGALGRTAAVLNDGTVLYAPPDTGLLADSAYVLPGSLRLSASDLRALASNLVRGMSVYFY